MSVETELCLGEAGYVFLKNCCNIIVENEIGRFDMHCENRFIGGFREISLQTVQKYEIRYRVRVVVLQRICIEADKTYVSCRKGKVIVAVDFFINLLSISETIVIANHANIRYFQLLQNISHPYKLLGDTIIALITTMNYKIYILAFVNCINNLFGLVRPSLSIAYHCKRNTLCPHYVLLNLSDIMCIYIDLSRDPPVVSMVIKITAAICKQ